MIVPKHNTSRKVSGRCETSEAIFRARLWASLRDQKKRMVLLGKALSTMSFCRWKEDNTGSFHLGFQSIPLSPIWFKKKKKKKTSSPEGSHRKFQSIWVLVQNLNSQMPAVADRWQKFVSQKRCNTKGGNCLNWQPLTPFSYILFQINALGPKGNKQTNKWPLRFLPVIPFQVFFSISVFPSLNPYPPVSLPNRTTWSWVPQREIKEWALELSVDSKPLPTCITWFNFSESGFVYNSYLGVWLRFDTM